MNKYLAIALPIAFLLVAGAGCNPTPNQPPAVMMHGMQTQTTGSMDRSIASLAAAQDQQIVDLKDGDSYPLIASFVHKTIAGKDIRMLAYNGEIAGPILRVKQGDSITVPFTNHLDQPTTVHWHGIRLDNANDGVPDVTQPTVQPGGTFTYTVKFPDAGLYWYHPHVREDYQQELGMYGLIWVEPNDQKLFDPVNQTAFISLDDILLSGSDVAPFDKTLTNHALMGRFGNVMLTNGQTDYTLQVHTNDVVRLAMVNTANTRTFNLSIPGVKLKLVGGDNGVFAKDTWVDDVLVGPSERAIVEVRFTKAGTYDMRHTDPQTQYKLGSIVVSDGASGPDYSAEFQKLQDHSALFADLASYYDKPIDQEIDLTINAPGMMGNMMKNQGLSPDGIEWEDSMAMMNAASTDKSLTWILKDKATGLENDKIDYEFKLGSKVKIRLFNDPASSHPMQHVIHFHGNRFVVLAIDGVKNTNPVWEDSELVPVGAKVDILLDASNPGTWMAHCHISEHLQSGMMLLYKVK
jgi:FtsP/CotA-like multicopper oxidase with cupredoxin domain